MASHSAGHLQPLDLDGPLDLPFEPIPETALTGSVVDRFEQMALRHGERLAVQGGTLAFTYSELASLANSLAGLIHSLSLTTAPVAILLPREARYLVAMLGVLRSGRPYLPLDATHPVERNRRIAHHCGATIVITSDDYLASAGEVAPPRAIILNLDELSGRERPPMPPRPSSEDLAYILYTSGTTGLPKGVVFNHRNPIHDTLQYVNAAHLQADDRLTLLYAPSVAGAVRDIYGALLTGASLHILSPQTLGPVGLGEAIRGNRITVLHAVPRLFRRIVRSASPADLETVRMVYLAGDRVEPNDVAEFRRAFREDACLMVAMGSTECSTAHSQWFVPRGFKLGSTAVVPVGRALPDRQVDLVGADSQPVPPGEIGEIWMRSPYAALGYWQDPEATAATFAVDASDAASRTVRTGDFGRRRPDGLLEFVGRKDHRISHHGHRIDLAEIEAIVRSAPDVGDAAVIARDVGEWGASAIVAFVVPAHGEQVHRDSLLGFLRQRLPKQMLPSVFHIELALPLLPSFKVDRMALAGLDAERQAAKPIRQATPREAAIASVFERVLEMTGLSVDDSIYTVDGDSLQTVVIAFELQSVLGLQGALEAIEAGKTIAELALVPHEVR